MGPNPEEKKKLAQSDDYKPPDKRACGRPHNTGWLDILGDEEMGGGTAKVSADPEDEVYESDNWREVIIQRQKISRS